MTIIENPKPQRPGEGHPMRRHKIEKAAGDYPEVLTNHRSRHSRSRNRNYPEVLRILSGSINFCAVVGVFDLTIGILSGSIREVAEKPPTLTSNTSG